MKPIIVIFERQLHRNELHSLIKKVLFITWIDIASLSRHDISPRYEKKDFSNIVINDKLYLQDNPETAGYTCTKLYTRFVE